MGGPKLSPPHADLHEHMYLELLAEHHVLVAYHIKGGVMTKGRVKSVDNGVITFQAVKRCSSYPLEEVDVIVPKEVLRWSAGELSPVTWR